MSDLGFVKESFLESYKTFQKLSENEDLQKKVALAGQWITESYEQKGRLFIAGNGGSASDAQHIAAEMVGKLWKDRNPLPAFAMTVDSSLLTAVGNDYGYNFIFSRQVEGLMNKNDIFLGITTSGNSANIIEALQMCRKIGAKSILLTGQDGGKAAAQNLADLVLIGPGPNTARIQETHIAIYHCLCFLVEKALIEKGLIQFR